MVERGILIDGVGFQCHFINGKSTQQLAMDIERECKNVMLILDFWYLLLKLI